MEDNITQQIEKKNNKLRTRISNLFLALGFLSLFVYYFLSAPFNNKDVVIHISSNQSVGSVASDLESRGAIRDSFTLKVFVKILKKGKGIVSGDYLIKKKSPIWIVAWQIGRGHHNVEPIKITIREGLNNEEIAILLADKLSGFRKDLFLFNTNDKQGYLFPDTYFFFPMDEYDEIIEKLSNNFKNKTKDISNLIKDKKWSDIIIMASILEGEAKGDEDAGIISGILWKRILVGMPLQVDVDKNTYAKKGLPSKPLNNPGISTIKASMNPIASQYLYYLHDKNGKVHYASTFEDHKKNINNYLK
jgi:UPF0755 protein